MNAYSNHAGGFTDQGGYTTDNLVAGEFPVVQWIETITGGVEYPRGAVLGLITASGLYTLKRCQCDGRLTKVCRHSGRTD